MLGECASCIYAHFLMDSFVTTNRFVNYKEFQIFLEGKGQILNEYP